MNRGQLLRKAIHAFIVALFAVLVSACVLQDLWATLASEPLAPPTGRVDCLG